MSHKCNLCGNAATRFSGGDVWRGHPARNIGVVFVCKDCDPCHKWFDYTGEELIKDASGHLHLKHK